MAIIALMEELQVDQGPDNPELNEDYQYQYGLVLYDAKVEPPDNLLAPGKFGVGLLKAVPGPLQSLPLDTEVRDDLLADGLNIKEKITDFPKLFLILDIYL